MWKKYGISVLLTLLLGSATGAHAGEFGDLYRAYQQAVAADKKEEVAAAAKTVYDYVSQALPEDNKNRAAITLNYGKALIQVKEYDLAERALQESLELYHAAYGEEAVEQVDPLMALAEARAKNQFHDHRMRYRIYVDQALEVAAALQGEETFLYATLAQEGGRIGLDEAGHLGAKKYLDKAHDLFSGPFQKYLMQSIMANVYLGKYHLIRKQYPEAEPYLLEAVAIADQHSEKDTQIELTARAFLVELYSERGDSDKSIAQCQAIGKATPFDMEQDPAPLFKRKLKYPPDALRSGSEGYAVVRYTLSREGLAENAEILEVNGHRHFGDAALEYVSSMRFAPRFENGEPVATEGRRLRAKFKMASE